jgi:hypothetical protein
MHLTGIKETKDIIKPISSRILQQDWQEEE